MTIFKQLENTGIPSNRITDITRAPQFSQGRHVANITAGANNSFAVSRKGLFCFTTEGRIYLGGYSETKVTEAMLTKTFTAAGYKRTSLPVPFTDGKQTDDVYAPALAMVAFARSDEELIALVTSRHLHGDANRITREGHASKSHVIKGKQGLF